MEGLHRHASTHAAGVVIAPGPLTDFVPLYQPPGTKDVATQADMNDLEAYKKIIPCGIKDKKITSVMQLKKKKIRIDNEIIKNFLKIFRNF